MTLPDQDVYELQIVETMLREGDTGYDGKEAPHDSWSLAVELLGTSNPDNKGKPFKGRIWNIKKGKATTLAYTADGTPKKSNLAEVLIGLGFTFDEVEKIKFDDVNKKALEGLFLRGTVKPKADGKNLEIKATGLISVKNEDHKRVNQERKAELVK